MRLAELQRRMAGAILSGDDDAMPPLAPGPIPAAAAIDVHRGTVMGALVNALRLTFPTVDELVGQAFFDQMAAAFVAVQPPRLARLSAYGALFPDFIEAYPLAATLPYLADVARLDLAVSVALAMPDAGPRRHVTLDAAVSLALPISLNVLSLGHAADLIRAGLEADDDQALAQIDLSPQTRLVAVWRTGRHAAVLALSPPAGLFLAAILKGADADTALAAAFSVAAPPAALQAIHAEVFAAAFAQITQTHLEIETR